MTFAAGDGRIVNGQAVDDPVERARLLARIREAVLEGGVGTRSGSPRPVVSDSWRRSLAAHIDPDRAGPPQVFDRNEVREIRRAHPLAEALPLLRHALVDVADEAMHMMIVTDADGHILWCEGQADVIRLAEPVGLTEGTRWAENAIGTNATPFWTAGTSRRNGHWRRARRAATTRSSPSGCSGRFPTVIHVGRSSSRGMNDSTASDI